MLSTNILFALVALAFPDPVPNLDVDDLCVFVAENIRESDPSKGTTYVWQTQLYEAANIDAHNDDGAAVRAKMQAFWNQYQDRLLCNVPNSVVRNGSILRLAADRSSTQFIQSVTYRWGLDLNYVDRNDGGTVLDWLDKEFDSAAAGTGRKNIISRYRRIMIDHGAKRASELNP